MHENGSMPSIKFKSDLGLDVQIRLQQRRSDKPNVAIPCLQIHPRRDLDHNATKHDEHAMVISEIISSFIFSQNYHDKEITLFRKINWTTTFIYRLYYMP